MQDSGGLGGAREKLHAVFVNPGALDRSKVCAAALHDVLIFGPVFTVIGTLLVKSAFQTPGFRYRVSGICIRLSTHVPSIGCIQSCVFFIRELFSTTPFAVGICRISVQHVKQSRALPHQDLTHKTLHYLAMFASMFALFSKLHLERNVQMSGVNPHQHRPSDDSA